MEEKESVSSIQPETENINSGRKTGKVVHITFLIVQLIVLFVVCYSLLNSGSYGWTLFCVIPFSIGLTIGTYARTYNNNGMVRGYVVLGFSLLIMFVGLLTLGAEGAICILMALGIIMVPASVGLAIGLVIKSLDRIAILAGIVLINSSAYVYDKHDESGVSATVQESIVVNAPAVKVWQVLTGKVKFSNSGNFFFKAGVSYPQNMQVKKLSNGSCFLNCNYRNGTIDLVIDKLDSLQTLRFIMPQNIVPMKEMSPYSELEAQHLNGYFKPAYGEFKLTPINKTQCRLDAITSYSYKITPAFYWRLWSDYFVNTMHRQVLNDIKQLAEN